MLNQVICVSGELKEWK